MGSDKDGKDSPGSGSPAEGVPPQPDSVAAAVERELAKAREREKYAIYKARLRSFIRLKVPGDPHGADTVEQESLQALIEAERMSPVSRESQIYGFASRKVAKHHRRSKRDAMKHTVHVPEGSELDTDGSAEVNAAENAVDRHRVYAKLLELPLVERAVFCLACLGKTGPEIAELCGIDQQQAYYRLRQAKARLAKSLGLTPSKEST